MDYFLNIGLKLFIGIIALIFQMNLFGKSNLAPISTLDQLQNFVLGGIIGGVIYNDQISILEFILVLIVWTFLVTFFGFIRANNRLFKNLIDGKPTTLIRDGKVLVDVCNKKGISATDLMFKLRMEQVYSTKHVKRAIQEQNGQLTVISYNESNVKFPIITNGFINQDILSSYDKTIEWLNEEIAIQGYTVDEIYLGEIFEDKLILTTYNE